jgi:hypothetical protein
MKITNEISENLLINAKKLLTNDNPIKTERVYIKPIYFSLNSTGHNLLQIKIVPINKAVPCKILTKIKCCWYMYLFKKNVVITVIITLKAK